MLTLDLPVLFGIIARPTCRKISVRDLPKFVDLLHMISKPIVVKVFADNNDGDKEVFKITLMDTMRMDFNITLTCATNKLYAIDEPSECVRLGHVHGSVHFGSLAVEESFLGMKWFIPSRR